MFDLPGRAFLPLLQELVDAVHQCDRWASMMRNDYPDDRQQDLLTKSHGVAAQGFEFLPAFV